MNGKKAKATRTLAKLMRANGTEPCGHIRSRAYEHSNQRGRGEVLPAGFLHARYEVLKAHPGPWLSELRAMIRPKVITSTMSLPANHSRRLYRWMKRERQALR